MRYALKVSICDKDVEDLADEGHFPIPNVGEIVAADGKQLEVKQRQFSYRQGESEVESVIELPCVPAG